MKDEQMLFDNKNEKNKVETLAVLAKNDDKLAFIELLGIFTPFISSHARSFGLPESEYDDLCQVGRIALYKALYSFDNERSSFTTFARTCIKNAMVSLVREYCAKNKLTISGVSLDELGDEFQASSDDESPESTVIAGEFIDELEDIMKSSLSASEKEIFGYKLSGIGIAEISVLTGKSTKSIENTLFRARRKLRERLRSIDN